MKRIVITGGPGAGKTASLEMARRTLGQNVGFAREAASVVFGGGFPREARERGQCAAQRAIFHVQKELESLFDDSPPIDVVLCDRGTLDCAAYWPSEEAELYRELGTTRTRELARYDVVIHVRPPPAEDGYEQVGLRIESAAEAIRIDARIEHAWRGHPRRFFVEHSHDFMAKMRDVRSIVDAELPCGDPAATLPKVRGKGS